MRAWVASKDTDEEARRMRARIRPEIWSPEWDDATERWTRKVCAQHAWRTRPLLDEEDLEQECRLKWLRCRELYPQVVEPAHFMALYKRAVLRHFTTRARERSRRVCAVPLSELSTHDTDALDAIQARPDDGMVFAEMRLLLANESPEIQKIVELIVFEDAASVYRNTRGVRETRAARLARLAEVSEKEGRGLLKRLRNLLAPTE